LPAATPKTADGRVLVAATALEILTGFALFAVPSLITRLLLGVDLTTSGETVSRIAGLAIFSLALGCWPRDVSPDRPAPALDGLLLLSVLVTAYLVYLGVSGGSTGVLLWPAAATHFVLTVLLLSAWFKGRRIALENGLLGGDK
jgi:hypothetical protein